MNREHIENFLKLNRIEPSAPDEEIRGALLAARWHERDVTFALTVLRGSGEEQPKADRTKRIFRTDQPITAETISSLFGIDIDLYRESLDPQPEQIRRQETSSTLVLLAAVVIALMLAFFITLVLMYVGNIGPFYSPVEEIRF